MPTVEMVVNLDWSGASGSPGVNVWHLRATSGPNAPSDLSDQSEAIHQFYVAIAGLYPGDVAIHMYGDLTGVGDDTGDLYTVPDWAVQGSGGSEYLPPANCLLASWRAASGGRSGRGRTFIGPLVSGVAEANGTPDETDRGTLYTAMSDLISDSQGFANGAVGIYSRKDSTFRDFVSGAVPNYFAVLRSRRD